MSAWNPLLAPRLVVEDEMNLGRLLRRADKQTFGFTGGNVEKCH